MIRMVYHSFFHYFNLQPFSSVSWMKLYVKKRHVWSIVDLKPLRNKTHGTVTELWRRHDFLNGSRGSSSFEVVCPWSDLSRLLFEQDLSCLIAFPRSLFPVNWGGFSQLYCNSSKSDDANHWRKWANRQEVTVIRLLCK